MKTRKVVHAFKHWASHRKDDLRSYSWCRRTFVASGRIWTERTNLSGVTCLACLRRIKKAARDKNRAVAKEMKVSLALHDLAANRLLAEQNRRDKK